MYVRDTICAVTDLLPRLITSGFRFPGTPIFLLSWGLIFPAVSKLPPQTTQ